MKVRVALFVVLGLLVQFCKNFEDASPTSRNSMIHFYGGSSSYRGVKAVEDSINGGLVIIGNISRNDFVSDMVVIKTNSLGKEIWRKIIPNSTGSDILVVSDGYLIVGDSIDYQPGASRISEIVNTRTRLIKMDFAQNTIFDKIKKDSVNVGTVQAPDYSQIDFHGSAITLDLSGNIVLLGSFKYPQAASYETTFVAGLNATSGNINWTQVNLLESRDYINSKSVHLTSNSRILWAATSERASQSITDAYATVLCTNINTILVDNPKLGENATDHYHISSDIQGAGNTFGIVGTFAKTDGTNSNFYFARATDNGSSVSLDNVKYYDGIHTEASADPNLSDYQDLGSAIAKTREGTFVLAGSMISTPTIGNGGKDILLIKISPFGDFIWNKLLGGSGDEEVSSIFETSSRDLLICGTNTVNGLSTIFIMRTDKNGQLSN